MPLVFGWTTALTTWRLIAAKLIAYPLESAPPDLSSARSTLRISSGDFSSLGWASFTVHDLAYHDIYPAPPWIHIRGDISEEEKVDIASRANDDTATGYEIPRPLDILLSDPGRRGGHPRGKAGERPTSRIQTFRPHVVRGLSDANCPDYGYYLLWDDTYIVSPEYLFVQMAAVLKDPVRIAVLGCELAGSYALLPLGLVSLKKQKRGHGKDNPLAISFAELYEADGYVERIPLTTVDKLRKFIDALPPNTYGVSFAKAALPLVKDGSRSPMETVSSIQLRLSRRRGGFGAGSALFNQRIDIKPEWRGILHKDFLVVDELFGPLPGEKAPTKEHDRRSHARKPKSVGVEYQGGYHATDWQMTADNQRRFALEDESLAIYFVTGKDFLDERVWNMIGERIAYDTGHDYGEPSDAMREKRASVHAILADPNLLKY